MTAMRWDPTQYARYADERNRPFFDLVGQVRSPAPDAVVDLGCGSGDLTVTLAQRWPQAVVRGIDSSPQMIARAPTDAGVAFSIAEADAFDATGVDVLISNALLQWVPGHLELLSRWAGELNPGGWLAFQVPSNFGAPSHRIMRELAESAPWRDRLHGVLRGTESVQEPARYLDRLMGDGLAVDAWQTEYQHVLQGPDPVLEWVRGTSLRPVLAALSPPDGERFCEAYAMRLRDAYPAQPYGTVFGFRRTFVVAHRP